MEAEPEYFARIDGRDHRVALNHFVNRTRMHAVVTILEGPENGQTVVVPVHDLRPDFTALPGPGDEAMGWASP